MMLLVKPGGLDLDCRRYRMYSGGDHNKPFTAGPIGFQSIIGPPVRVQSRMALYVCGGSWRSRGLEKCVANIISLHNTDTLLVIKVAIGLADIKKALVYRIANYNLVPVLADAPSI